MRNVSCPVRRGADGKGPGHRNLASRLPYNLIAQLKGGVKALAMPVDDLVSNWAYMVMASLAWSLKAWSGLGAAGARAVGGEVPGGEAFAAADGVQHLLRGDDPGAVPDRADSRSDRVPVAVVEPVAGRIPEAGGAVARPSVVLRRRRPEAGVRMLRSVWATNRREAVW